MWKGDRGKFLALALAFAACGPQPQPTPTQEPRRLTTPTDAEVIASFRKDFDLLKGFILKTVNVDPEFWQAVENVDNSNLRSVFASDSYARPIPPEVTYILSLPYKNRLTRVTLTTHLLPSEEAKLQLFLDEDGKFTSQALNKPLSPVKIEEILRKTAIGLTGDLADEDIIKGPSQRAYGGKIGIVERNGVRLAYKLDPYGNFSLNASSIS